MPRLLLKVEWYHGVHQNGVMVGGGCVGSMLTPVYRWLVRYKHTLDGCYMVILGV